MNQTVYYMVLYVSVLIAALIGAYLKIVSPDLLASVIGVVIGHGSGLFTPAPDSTSTKVV